MGKTRQTPSATNRVTAGSMGTGRVVIFSATV